MSNKRKSKSLMAAPATKRGKFEDNDLGKVKDMAAPAERTWGSRAPKRAFAEIFEREPSTASNDSVPELKRVIEAQNAKRVPEGDVKKFVPADMYVVKRNGERVLYNADDIRKKIKDAAKGLDGVDVPHLTELVVDGIVDGMTTQQIDYLTIKVSSNKFQEHLDYNKFACRIKLSDLYKTTPAKFSESVAVLTEKGFVDDEYQKRVDFFGADVLDAMIDEGLDSNLDILGLLKLTGSYLMSYYKLHPSGKVSERIVVERPSYMYLRIALGLANDTIENVKYVYGLFSEQWGTMATPTLTGTYRKYRPGLTSCFLVEVLDDSVAGIMETATRLAHIAAHAGGVAVYLSCLRPLGSPTRTGAEASGPVGFSMIFDSVMFHMMQGPNTRRANAAMYIDAWHANSESLVSKRSHEIPVEDNYRASFPALLTPNLLLKMSEEDEEKVFINKEGEREVKEGQKLQMWPMFSPQTCPELMSLYGQAFDKRYAELVAEGKTWSEIPALDYVDSIAKNIATNGSPYVLLIDQINEKTNHQNLGKVKMSNLCTEILEYTEPNEPALCNLSTVVAAKFVKGFPATAARKREFDYKHFWDVCYQFAKFTDSLIDKTSYPFEECKTNNKKRRPIGCGLQGVADAVFMMGMAWDSLEGKDFIKSICETQYHACITASVDLSILNGPYEGFHGSPMSKGKLQYDMWNDELEKNPWMLREPYVPTGRWDMEELRQKVMKHGIRNSLSVAHPPTVSTSEIVGGSEGTDPFMTNSGVKAAQHGEFYVLNKPLFYELEHRKMWSPKLGRAIAATGSIQKLTMLPAALRKRAKTAFEVSKDMIAMVRAEAIGPNTCQTVSSNNFNEKPSTKDVKEYLYMARRMGLKVANYYGKNKAKVNGISNIAQTIKEFQGTSQEDIDGTCSVYDVGCTSCSG